MRLFVGLDLPSELAQRLAALSRRVSVPNPRWTAPVNLHLTLAFLGEVTEDRLPSIQTQLAKLHDSPLNLTVTHLDTFPGVLFAAIEPTPALLGLQSAVASAMYRCGFPLEERVYHPHLTLARTRSHFSPALRASLPHLQAAHFTANEVHLYRSHPTPGGSCYEILYSTPLRGSLPA